MEDEKIITLATYTFQQAQIVETLLKANGIDCFLQNINLIHGAVSAGVKLKIKEYDLSEAMKILETIKLQVVEDTTEEEQKSGLNIPKVLLPVDFSDYSKKAGEVALEWASRLNAELMVINVYYALPLNNFSFTDTFANEIHFDDATKDLETQAKEELNEFVNNLQTKNRNNGNNVVVKHKLLCGIAEDEILYFSREYNPTVVIMGTRGKDKKAIDLIGSVTAEVAEKANVPVLAIPEDFDYKGIGNIRNILYATNFEEADFAALQKLEIILKPLNARIFFVHVGLQKGKQWDIMKLEGLKSYINKLVPDVEVNCDLIEAEDFWVGLESYIQREKIDIISFTTYRRGLVARILYPNIGRKMLFQTTTPMLVFHA